MHGAHGQKLEEFAGVTSLLQSYGFWGSNTDQQALTASTLTLMNRLAAQDRVSFETQLVTNKTVKLSSYFCMCVLSLRQKGVGLNSEHPKKSSSGLLRFG